MIFWGGFWFDFSRNIFLSLFAALNIKHVGLEVSENLQRHRTEDFISSRALVVRRGAPFRISLQLGGRPLNPMTDKLRVKVMLGNLHLSLHLSGEMLMLASSSYFFYPGLKLLYLIIFLPFRPPVCTDASHLLQEPITFLLLESLYWPRESEPMEPVHIHPPSCFSPGGLLQIPSERAGWRQLAGRHLPQICPALQPLVFRWVS